MVNSNVAGNVLLMYMLFSWFEMLALLSHVQRGAVITGSCKSQQLATF